MASEHWPLPFTYPPFAALLFSPLTLLPAALLRVLFVLSSTAALGRILWLSVVALEREVRPSAWTRRSPVTTSVILLLALVVVEPILVNQRLGQINLFLGWLVVEDLVGVGARSRWRGALTGLAAAIKLTPAVFGLYLLLRRDWAGVARATATGLAATGFGAVALPHSTWDFITRAVLDPSRVGGVAYSSNQSLNGAIWRLLGEGGSRALWLALVVAVVAAATWVMLRLLRLDMPMSALLVNALVGLLVSPVSWSHHWYWLLPAAFMVLVCTEALPRRRWPGLTLVVATALCLATWVTRWMPAGDDREYAVPLAGKLLTDAYAFCAIGIIAWLAWYVASGVERARAGG